MGNSINRQRTDGLTAARYLYDPAGGYFDGRGRACYYIPDYQGNNLGVVDAEGHLTQRTDYYPYGEAWRQPEADVNPWLYSDKELLSVDGQHEYDFGPRRYTPGFPMFTTPDQMSEVRPWHSPYLFCGANPVMNTDPTGMMYFYNLNGERIDVEDPNPDDHNKYIILTKKKDVKIAEELIQKGSYILVPTPAVLDAMEECMQLTEKDNLEHGFVVGQDNEVSQIFNGYEHEINFNYNEFKDSQGRTVTPLYDVHTHPTIGDGSKSRVLYASPNDTKTYQRDSPGIVLGRYDNLISSNPFTEQKENRTKPTWTVSFYGKDKEFDVTPIKYSTFKSKIKKIWSERREE